MAPQGDHKPDHRAIDRELWLAAIFFICMLPAIWPFLLGQGMGEWVAARIERCRPADETTRRWASLIRRLFPLAIVLTLALAMFFAAQAARSFALQQQKARPTLSLPDRDRD